MKCYFLRRIITKCVTCKVKRKSISPVKRSHGFTNKSCIKLQKKSQAL